MTRTPLLPIGANTADVFGELAGMLTRAHGRSHRTRLQDLWLASQGIQHSVGRVTRNPGDFADIPGLDVVHRAAGPTRRALG